MVKIKLNSKKALLIGLVVVLAAAAGGIYYAKKSDSTEAKKAPDVKLAPATKEEKQDAEENKEAIVAREKQRQSQPPGSGPTPVKPVITYAGQYDGQVEIGGYVNGIFEEGGTCTANFVNGSSKLAQSVKAVRGANSVDCPMMAVSGARFNPKGNWTVTVSYSSGSASGASDAKTIEVK